MYGISSRILKIKIGKISKDCKRGKVAWGRCEGRLPDTFLGIAVDTSVMLSVFL